MTLLESGDVVRRDYADALDEIENAGWPRVTDQWLARNRIVGGTSHTWSGRCVPFDTIDFQTRRWVPESGWPLSAESLTPYLDRAAPYLGMCFGTGFSDTRFWHLAGRPPPAPRLDAQLLRSHFWQFSRDESKPSDYTRFGVHLAAKLGANVKLVTNATVCHINVNASGDAVQSVEVAAPGGERRTLRAKTIVLCAGGIENARLLLCSNRVVTAGLGNEHDRVGRYLMDHLRGPTANFQIKGAEHLRKLFGHYRIKGGQVFAHGVRLSDEVQQAEELLNCAAWLEGSILEDDPWNALKRWLRGKPNPRQDAAAIFGNIGLLLRGARDYFIERNGLLRKIGELRLVCMCEQIPDPESRVTLSAQRDRLGMPRARIDWRVHELEAQTLRRLTELVTVEFARVGLPVPRPYTWVRDHAPLPQTFQDVAHPTGTTRMGTDPACSVVDTQCKVHGIEGLYVAGSSVFPTSSHANPTQMIVALALRLADTIKTRATQN
ncbi:MAG: GMC family oxidoreductase [Acidiphilium sp.]|nr:GMC family oxidoreductase [Acidiphilium sp.]MDD4936626.1 GMC family oxidoreductase [Acidiphilium sp.]